MYPSSRNFLRLGNWKGGRVKSTFEWKEKEEEEPLSLSLEKGEKADGSNSYERNIAIICKVYEGYINFAKTVENR